MEDTLAATVQDTSKRMFHLLFLSKEPYYRLGLLDCLLSGSLSLYATEVQLLKVPPDVKQMAKVVEAVTLGSVPDAVACKLLCCNADRLWEFRSLHQNDQTDPEYKRELRRQVLLMTAGVEANGKISAPPSMRQRKARVSKVDLEFLDRLEDHLKKQYANEPLRDSWEPQSDIPDVPSDFLDLPDASSARGPLSRSEYFHGKKWPQICWFLGRLQSFRRKEEDSIPFFRHILDVGGGRGDLAVHIASTFGVKVTVVDTCESSLQAGKLAASKHKLHINFVNVDFSIAADKLPLDIDFVVALHACGGLSDAALDFASQRQIPFMICPCCHLKNQDLEPSAGWSSLCEAEVADMELNDNKFQGSLTEIPSQILRKLAEIDRQDVSWRALNLIAALRIQASRKRYEKIVCKLGAFSRDYSQRTLCLKLK